MMNYLPSKLNKLRKHYNYSQQYVADRMGIDVVTYMGYENGNSMINYRQMKKLASIYHVSVNEIFLNSDEVKLYKTKEDTNEINISYFLPENNLKNKIKDFVINHKVVTIIIISLITAIVVLSIILGNITKPYKVNKENINRLSASETTVIYIDDSGAIGFSGSNSNGQLNDLAITGAIKVCEGNGFSVVLDEKGKLKSSGLLAEYQNELESLNNIVDVAVGNNHVVAVDSNGKVYCIGNSEACDIDGTRNIKKVFATENSSIVIDVNGQPQYKGTFIGSSYLKDFNNIIDIASSDNILAILNDKHMLNVFSKNGSYLKSETWTDLVDVACGNDFVAALDSYGKVNIEIDSDEYEQEVKSWSNIIAIAAGKDYLIAFDGKNIYGIGNNSYNQFSKEEKQKITLEKVKNINYTVDQDNIYIQFDGVNNASRYLVSLDVGTGLSKRINENEIAKFSTENMIDGKTYVIKVIAEGEGDYKDSDVSEESFVFNRPIQIDVIVSNFIGKDPVELENYFTELGIKYSKNEDDNSSCSNEKGCVIDIVGINDGKYTKQELESLDVIFTYSKVEENNE